MRIALDFDGTIHAHVSPWVDSYTIADPPIPGAIDWVRKCLVAGHSIIIHTARFAPDKDLDAVAKALDDWFLLHGLEPEYLLEGIEYHVVVGKPKADIYIDDRGYRFTGQYPDPNELPSRAWYR